MITGWYLEEAREQKLFDWYIERVRLEGPQHRVTLTQPFGLAIHEVTRGQFRQFVEATGYKTDAQRNGLGGRGYRDGVWLQSPDFQWDTSLGFENEQTDEHPVINVSWNDATVSCKWLSKKEGLTYRLPTEAEWEYACRAGNEGRYCFGNEEWLLDGRVWSASQGGRNTMPVGLSSANAFGVFDLHGNASEWCEDRFTTYSDALVVDPVGSTKDTRRVHRGGTFLAYHPLVRSAQRMFQEPHDVSLAAGFRVARQFEISELNKAERTPSDN